MVNHYQPATTQHRLPGAPDAMEYKDLNVKLMCKDCRNPVPNIIEEFAAGDLVCGDCGMVLGDRIIDTRSEWRTFSNEEGNDPSRVGATSNPLLEGSQLDTSIKLTGGNTTLAKNLNKTLNRTNNTKAVKSKIMAHKDITALCEAAGLSKSVSEISKQIFNMVIKTPSLKVQVRHSLLAACIFCACRQEGVPRTFREVSAFTQVPKEDIGKCYKSIIPYLEMSGKKTTSGADLMGRFCSFLNLPMEVQTAASDLVKRAREIDSVAGRSPVSIAAATIYFMSHLFNMGKTLQEISDVSSVSPSTIRVTYKALYAERTSLVDINSYRTPVTFNSLPSS
ncbi:transcription initiation factor IIB [Entomophthora muscae]|uniref:Transcription initiation factor IIB n=1 Tax=Entomophthora muscae TaxID=34485 RepID=A0ACC2UCH4_9FUNG|nr:transcription initiation factor IIB [Entomophthora muscae]